MVRKDAMSTPSESPQPQSPIKGRQAAGRSFGRAANWTVGVAAAALVLISAGGYFYHREELSALAAEHLRLVVTGPSRLQAGVAADYLVSTTAINGQPMPAQIEVALLGPDGTRLKADRETADEHGRLPVAIPAELTLPSATKLRVVAFHGESRESMEFPLTVEPACHVTDLALDGSLYEPGQTVRYRSLTLSRFALASGHEMPVHFEIVAPAGTVVPKSSHDVVTKRGVASGDFTIPDSLAAGRYTLVVRSPDRAFAEQKRPFFISSYQPAASDKATKAAGKGQAQPTVVDPNEIDVAFYPEGGQLAAGLENRVYFLARNSSGEPVELSGVVTAASRDKDNSDRDVAAVKTTFRGMGAFSFAPVAGETYRLRITSPKGVKNQRTLPEVSSEREVMLSAGEGVFAAEKPVEFNLRAARAGLPLVVAAYCRGVQVGQQPLVTKVAQPIRLRYIRIVRQAARCDWPYTTTAPARRRWRPTVSSTGGPSRN